MMMSTCWNIIGLCLLVPSVLSYGPGDPFYNKEKIQSVASWASLDYTFPSVQTRQESIQHGDFIPGSPTPIDFEILKSKLLRKKLLIQILNIIINYFFCCFFLFSSCRNKDVY